MLTSVERWVRPSHGDLPEGLTVARLLRSKRVGPSPALKAVLKVEVSSDEVQRVSACMLGAVAPASLAHVAVLGMEMGMLRRGWPVGQLLGALPDVRKQLGLGRPAFREAVTILEARGLLDVRRGPGGGLFIAAPTLDDVASAVLLYLAVAGGTHACLEEFRTLVWRMAVTAAIRQCVRPSSGGVPSQWGFAVDLAERSGNATIALLARLAETLMRNFQVGATPSHDCALDAAVKNGDLAKALKRLDELAGPTNPDATVVTLELAERGFSLSGRKSAMALAARMARELSEHTGTQEAEWETAERLGYTEAVVRQARRILQDFGMVRCRQGRKGAELAPAAAPTGVIRLLAPLIVASATSALDNWEAISFLISCAPVLGARRATAQDSATAKQLVSSSSLDTFEALTLENRLLELSGNPLLATVVRSLGLATFFAAGDFLSPTDRSEVIALNRRILPAIQDGDVVGARVLAKAKLQVMQRPFDLYRDVA